MKRGILFLTAMSAFAAAPTFNHDIAPLLYRNCAECHRPGQVAPFSLLSYEDAKKRAALIAAVTEKRYMPPWKAETGYGHFQDERRLSDAEIARIGAWVKAGAPEGDPMEKPTPPQFASGWLAGKPDAVLAPASSFNVPADGRDVFQCFVVPMNFDAERYVKTVEFHPGNPRVVHHALFFLDMTGEARRLAATRSIPVTRVSAVRASFPPADWADGRLARHRSRCLWEWPTWSRKAPIW